MISEALSSTAEHKVCPWWHAYMFDNPLRKLIHPPQKVLGAYVKEAMTVIDVGCGMGHFSIGMASLVGSSGKVVAIDLQQKMLDVMRKRANRAGVADRIVSQLCTADGIDIKIKADFVLAFWMVHEVPDQRNFLEKLKSIMVPGGKILIAEPKMHVSSENLAKTVEIAQSIGFKHCEAPKIRFSHSALLEAIKK